MKAYGMKEEEIGMARFAVDITQTVPCPNEGEIYPFQDVPRS
jgi:hypothetical protein